MEARDFSRGRLHYLTKPFEMRELVVRIDAMTRKRVTTIMLGDVSIDTMARHEVM